MFFNYHDKVSMDSHGGSLASIRLLTMFFGGYLTGIILSLVSKLAVKKLNLAIFLKNFLGQHQMGKIHFSVLI